MHLNSSQALFRSVKPFRYHAGLDVPGYVWFPWAFLPQERVGEAKYLLLAGAKETQSPEQARQDPGNSFQIRWRCLAAPLARAPGPTDRGLHGAPAGQHERKEVHQRNLGKRGQIARDVRIPISSQHP
jgi:hypothetical protein